MGAIRDTTTITADAYSDEIVPNEHEGFSITAAWTGTLVGPLYLQYYNEAAKDWVSHPTVVFSANPAGVAGNGECTVTDTTHLKYRVFFDFTSGSGTLPMNVNY